MTAVQNRLVDPEILIHICLLNTILSKVIGGGGFSICRNFLFLVIANAGIFVPGNTLCRIFSVGKHYFLDWLFHYA